MKRMAMRRIVLTPLLVAGLLALALGAGALLAQEKAGDETKKADSAASRTAEEAKKSAPTSPAVARIPIYTGDNAPAAPRLEELPLKESVSQYGITWTFEKPSHVGQFINGDGYVVGEVTVKMIDPKPLWGDEVKDAIDKDSVKESKYPGKQARNGSTHNPQVHRDQWGECLSGFDSRTPSDRYDPELFTPLPIKMVPGDSLVSTISRPTSEIKVFIGQFVDPLRVAAVLTCVAEPQPADAFRPSYCDSKNSRVYLARNLKRDALLNLPRMPKQPATLAWYAGQFQKPWLDLSDFGFAAPRENMPHYGQQMVELQGEATLLLLMDYSPEEKEPLLVNLVQVGIDFYGLARGGMIWHGHGGLNSGRKWPIIFAGVMLDDADMQNPGKNLPNLRFAEDEQTAFCPVTYKGKTYETGWTGAKAVHLGHSPYLWDKTEKDEGGGPQDLYPPSQWPLKKKGEWRASEAYRRSNTSGAWVAEALTGRMMHIEKVWNHDAFYAYVDRWMTEDDTPTIQPIKDAGFPDLSKVSPHTFGREGFISSEQQAVPWIRAMWDKYRNNLPPAKDGSKTPPAEQTWK